MELFTDCCLLATKCILSLSGFHRTGYEGLSTSSASLSKGIQGIERIDTLRDYAAYLFLKKFFVNFDKISRVFEPWRSPTVQERETSALILFPAVLTYLYLGRMRWQENGWTILGGRYHNIMCWSQGTEKLNMISYQPQCHGIVGRFIRTLENAVNISPMQWEHWGFPSRYWE